MHILILQNTDTSMKPIMDVTKEHIKQIQKFLPTTTIVIKKDTENFEEALNSADIVITGDITTLPIEKAKNLKWIQVTSAGVNNLPEILKTSDIIITNASGVHPIPIAEHVLGFMLMFSRQLYKSFRTQIEKKQWERHYIDYPAFELYGKTISLFGMGRIGSRIAKLAKGLDMHVLAMVRDTSKNYPSVDEVFLEKDVATLLSRSDFVINAMPLTPQTKHFFAMDQFKNMKPTAYFINIGRGPVVHEKDLITALQKEIIAGAGLDVFEEEPLPNSSPLWKLKNVIVTPHYSGWTPEYMNRVIDIFCTNLAAYLKKKPMPNLVDKSKGY